MNVKGVKINDVKYPFDYRYLADSPSSDKELIFGVLLDTNNASTGSDGDYYIFESINRGANGLYLPLMLKHGDTVVVSYGGSEYEFEVNMVDDDSTGYLNKFVVGGDGYPFEIEIYLDKYMGRSYTAYMGVDCYCCYFETENETELMLIYKRGGCIKHTVCSLPLDSGQISNTRDVDNIYKILWSIDSSQEEMEFELVIDGTEYRTVKRYNDYGTCYDIGYDLCEAGILPYTIEFSSTGAEIQAYDPYAEYEEPELIVINVPHKDLKHLIVFDDNMDDAYTLSTFVGMLADEIKSSSGYLPSSDYIRIELL